jgi:hypothetical protein
MKELPPNLKKNPHPLFHQTRHSHVPQAFHGVIFLELDHAEASTLRNTKNASETLS